MLEFISALVAVVAGVVATVQAYVARVGAHGELVADTLKEFWLEPNVRARAHVFGLQGKSHAEWTDEDCAIAENVGLRRVACKDSGPAL